jgi:succinoglycan biosynthesis transport protein ExoP
MANTESERQQTVRLEDYLRIARERWWIIVLAVAIVVAVALYMSLSTTPLYTTSARLVYQRNDLDSMVSGYGLYTYEYDKDRTIATSVAAIKNSELMAEAVKAQLTSMRSAAELMGMVSVSTNEGSDLVNIGATSTDPDEAAEVANAYANRFIIYRKNADRVIVAEARSVVKEQLDTISAAERESG